MDQAFAAIWNVLRADDPFRDYANDNELRNAIGHKLLDLVVVGTHRSYTGFDTSP